MDRAIGLTALPGLVLLWDVDRAHICLLGADVHERTGELSNVRKAHCLHQQPSPRCDIIIRRRETQLLLHLIPCRFGIKRHRLGDDAHAVAHALAFIKTDRHRGNGILLSWHKIRTSIESGYMKPVIIPEAEISLAFNHGAMPALAKGNLHQLAMLDEQAIVRHPVQQRHRKLLRLLNRHLVPESVIHPVDLLATLPKLKNLTLHITQAPIMRLRLLGPHLSRDLARRYLHVGLLSNRESHLPTLSIA